MWIFYDFLLDVLITFSVCIVPVNSELAKVIGTFLFQDGKYNNYLMVVVYFRTLDWEDTIYKIYTSNQTHAPYQVRYTVHHPTITWCFQNKGKN